ncbi:hypothetical protein [Dorea sp.]|uniref:hypothetical protein n=1 Tax=Dorea sp. TaxID=2040332 RepID=UPI003527D995
MLINRGLSFVATVIDIFRGTITNTMLSFSCRSNKKSIIAGESQCMGINKSFRNGLL